jgi:hypothetical protein
VSGAQRAFLVVSIATFALAALVCLLVGRVVDPLGDFNTGLFPPLEPSARVAKLPLLRAEAAVRSVDGLLIGSSRTVNLEAAEFDRRAGRHFFNLGVEGARAEDYVALSRWARRVGVDPEWLVVGVDVEALHDNWDMERPLKLSPELMRALNDEPEPGAAGRLLDAMARNKNALTTLHIGKTAEAAVHIGWYAYQLGKLPDPSETFRLPTDWNLRALPAQSSTPQLERTLAGCHAFYVARFATMTSLSEQRRGRLEQTVREATERGARVVLWLAPLHPSTDQLLRRTTQYGRLLDATRAFVAELGARYGAQTHDLSDPVAFGADGADWNDCAHPGPVSSRRIVETLTRPGAPDRARLASR